MTDYSTIAHGAWDSEDWADAQAAFPNLADLEMSLLEVASLGPWLAADTFQVLHKAVPRLRDDSPPRAALNRTIVEQLLDGGLDELRTRTVGDSLFASVALLQLGDRLATLLTEAQRVQDAADEAADTQAAYEQACDEAGEEPGSDHDDDGLTELAQAAAAAATTLDAETSAIGPAVAAAVAEAAEAASEKIDQYADAADGWGLTGGTEGTGERLALLDRLSSGRLGELSKLIGRLRIDAGARPGDRWDAAPGEITDVRPSNDLSRMVSSELIYLADDRLRPQFVQRYLTKQLLCLHMEDVAREDSGSIIYLEDSSGTMAGARTLWARAVGIRLLETAIDQHRGFRAVVFSGAGQFKVFDFGDDAATSTLDQRLAYAEFTMDGATDFQGPCLAALTFIEDEHDRFGRSHADVVLATDGRSEVTDDFVAKWAQARAELGFRCYGLMIQHPVTAEMVALCDQITSEDRLTDGANLVDLFDQVAQAPVVAR